MTGSKRGQQIDKPMYFAVDELINSSNHGSDEEDVGGVHGYMEIESSLQRLQFNTRNVCTPIK